MAVFLEAKSPARVRVEAFAGLLLTATAALLASYPNVFSVAAVFVAPAILAFLVRLVTPFPLRRFPWLRRYLVAAVAVALAGIVFDAVSLVGASAARRARPRAWGESFQSEADVRQELARSLPPGADASAVLAFARARGLECSEPTVSVIRCTSPAPSPSLFVARTWLVDLAFTEGKLSSVSVTQGLTAP